MHVTAVRTVKIFFLFSNTRLNSVCFFLSALKRTVQSAPLWSSGGRYDRIIDLGFRFVCFVLCVAFVPSAPCRGRRSLKPHVNQLEREGGSSSRCSTSRRVNKGGVCRAPMVSKVFLSVFVSMEYLWPVIVKYWDCNRFLFLYFNFHIDSKRHS